MFEPLVEAADPEDHPFAALKALQVDAENARREEAESASEAQAKVDAQLDAASSGLTMLDQEFNIRH